MVKNKKKRIWINGYYTYVDQTNEIFRIERTEKLTIAIHLMYELRKHFIIYYDSEQGHYIVRKRQRNIFERIFNL